MKTLILSKKELDGLSKEAQQEVMAAYNSRANELKELKARIKAFPFKLISYREDIGMLDDLRIGGKNLTFRIRRKTGGEQWGNSVGREYEIRIGHKYIRVDGTGFCTNSPDWDIGSFYISASKLGEIVDLVEEAMNMEDVYSPDATAILKIAVNRMSSLVDDYQNY
jgi:hypothetical protein